MQGSRKEQWRIFQSGMQYSAGGIAFTWRLSNSRLGPKLTECAHVCYRCTQCQRSSAPDTCRSDGRILNGPKTNSSHPGRRLTGNRICTVQRLNGVSKQRESERRPHTGSDNARTTASVHIHPRTLLAESPAADSILTTTLNYHRQNAADASCMSQS